MEKKQPLDDDFIPQTENEKALALHIVNLYRRLQIAESGRDLMAKMIKNLGVQPPNFNPMLSGPVRVFMDIDIAGVHSGRLVINLFPNTPITGENFRSLCTGERGNGIAGKPLHYRGCKFFTIFAEFNALCGDIIENSG